MLRNHQEEKYECPPEHEAIQMVELSSDGSYLKMIRQLDLEKLAKCITFLVKGIVLFQKQFTIEKATASTSSSSSSMSHSSSSEATDPSNPELMLSSHKVIVIKPSDFTKLRGNVRNFQKICHKLKFGLITELLIKEQSSKLLPNFQSIKVGLFPGYMLVKWTVFLSSKICLKEAHSLPGLRTMPRFPPTDH